MQLSDLQISGSGSSAGLIPVSMANSHGVVIAYPGPYNATSDSFPITYGTPVPVISSVSPSQGPTVGGTTVVINGDYLTGASSVSFGTTSVPYTVNPDNSLTVTAPAEPAATVDVTVTTPGGSSTHSHTPTPPPINSPTSSRRRPSRSRRRRRRPPPSGARPTRCPPPVEDRATR
jgi:hypothetical protein